MAKYDIELVGKIGSMALITTINDIDYNVFSRIGRDLVPGMIWVGSGGRDRKARLYKRTGMELEGDKSAVMTDYSSRAGILMEEYRRFIWRSIVRQYSLNIRANDESRGNISAHSCSDAPAGAIPIVNYNGGKL